LCVANLGTPVHSAHVRLLTNLQAARSVAFPETAALELIDAFDGTGPPNAWRTEAGATAAGVVIEFAAAGAGATLRRFDGDGLTGVDTGAGAEATVTDTGSIATPFGSGGPL
jgi:hypothetical protein